MDSEGAPVDDLLGQVVGGAYRLTRCIGRGGMGVVYEADHVRIPRRFAVKFLLINRARTTNALVRFRREAEIASQLVDAHIASVLDFNTLEDGTPYIVMELLEGESLGARLRRVPLEREEIILVTDQIARALTTAHERGVIHRDLKPENVFLAHGEGARAVTVKLLDFGISKIGGVADSLTATDAILGTPAYMSPEQARGDKARIDARTDVYSFGALLYEIFAGRPPFTGETAYEILSHLALSAPAPISSAPPGVDAAIQRAMLKQPEGRQVSARALADDLIAALGGTGDVPTREVIAETVAIPRPVAGAQSIETALTAAATTPVAEPATIPMAESATSLRVGRRRRRAALSIVIAAAVAAAAAALWVSSRRGEEIAAPAPGPTPTPEPAPAPPPRETPVQAETPAQVETPAPAAPAPVERVTIRLRVRPAAAQVLLDGRHPVKGGVVDLERTTASRAVVVRARGYVERTIAVIPDEDKTVSVVLVREDRRRVRRKSPAERTPSLVGGSDL